MTINDAVAQLCKTHDVWRIDLTLPHTKGAHPWIDMLERALSIHFSDSTSAYEFAKEHIYCEYDGRIFAPRKTRVNHEICYYFEEINLQTITRKEQTL